MKIQQMKSLIAALLLLGSTSIFAQGVDYRFPALLMWNDWIRSNATTWDKMCDKDPTKEGCSEMRAILTEQYVMFIEAANRYSTEGTDCRAKLRPECIKFLIRAASYNVNCAGIPSNEPCRKEDAAINEAQKVLQKQVSDCDTSTKL